MVLERFGLHYFLSIVYSLVMEVLVMEQILRMVLAFEMMET